jgi:hypothetical protein
MGTIVPLFPYQCDLDTSLSDQVGHWLVDVLGFVLPLFSQPIGGKVVVFNATFNNISVVSWRSVLLMEETGLPGENHWPATLTNFITWCIDYTSPWAWFKLTTVVVIGIDCICSCKSNCRTIMSMMTPCNK